MIDPGRGAVRHLRAMAAALACVTTAFAAHTVSGGDADLGTVTAVFVLSGAIAWALAGVRLSRSQILGLLALCQVGVHLASMATSSMPHAMGASMWLAHGAATLLSVAALARGESFVWAMTQRLTLRPLALLRAPRVPVGRPLLVSVPVHTVGPRIAARITPVRGPPTEPAFVSSFL